ncbi:hypothetical protein HYU13_06680 [Candidatus Woesearchaeota archaeon]|nr:hypothetical protein [Candidatus Woesearchaeota archaeon]
MGKAKIKKKIAGYEKQLAKHIEKFKEAMARDSPGSMNYMAREMRDFLRRKKELEVRLLPKGLRKKLKANG